MKNILPISLTLLLLFESCKENQSLKDKQSILTNGNIDSSFKYTCDEIGWQTYLPKDWNVMTKAQNAELSKKGKDIIEKSSGLKVDASSLKELVNLKKDPVNSFLSTIENYDEKTDGNYYENVLVLYKVLSDTYKSQNIKFEMKQDSEIIDKVNFYTLEVKVYKPKGDGILITQKLYGQLLKGYDFGMTITYNNEQDKEILMNIIKNSKFHR